MSCRFPCVIICFVTVPSHVVKWFARFCVPMPSTCVYLMIYDLINHEVLRVCFILLLAIVRFIFLWFYFYFLYFDGVSSWSLFSVSSFSSLPATMSFMLASCFVRLLVSYPSMAIGLSISSTSFFVWRFGAITTLNCDTFSTDRSVFSITTVLLSALFTLYGPSAIGASSCLWSLGFFRSTLRYTQSSTRMTSDYFRRRAS